MKTKSEHDKIIASLQERQKIAKERKQRKEKRLMEKLKYHKGTFSWLNPSE